MTLANIIKIVCIAISITACQKQVGIYRSMLMEGYEGEVIEKYQDKRGAGCFLMNLEGERIQAPVDDPTIFDKVSLEDTIRKFSNSNKCLLIKGKKVYRYNCYYIPPEIMAQLGEIEEW